MVPNSDVVRIKCDREEGGETGLKLCVEDGGGIIVDSGMRTSLGDVYAAGDVCSVQWKEQAALWFQVTETHDTVMYIKIIIPQRSIVTDL